MNERLKKIRKSLDLTQQEFANRIGIARGNIAAYEVGKNAPSDAVISLICREFNVNENWLRTGAGGPDVQFVNQATFSLDDYVKSKGATDLEIELVKTYFEMDPAIRDSIVEHFMKKFSKGSYGTAVTAPVTPVTSSSENKPTVIRAAHLNHGATPEQIAADDAIMEGDDF